MALDKLVDSTKLDAALEATADAIREKTGDTDDIAFDLATETGFAEAVEAIPSGGSSATINIKNYTSDVQNINLDVDTLTINSNGFDLTAGQMFRNLNGMKELVLNFSDSAHFSWYKMFAISGQSTPADTTLKRVILNADTSGGARFDNLFSGRNALEEIEGAFDLTGMTYFDKALPVGALREVRFVPNTIKNDFNPFGYPNWDVVSTLSNDSLVSMANGLDSTASGKTFKIAKGIGPKLQSILGTVSEGIFTADEEGETNLQAFITGVKGWTVTTA